MPTHEYECETCRLRFERRHAIPEDAIAKCPGCSGSVRRPIGGAAERCGKPQCGGLS
ncbi:MAG TPA: zinc ribbon domain-containing protein [Syntrophales bacterium]|nr:zinc ribbon domain-containing protein [Syntrophales bacterium]